MKHQADDVCFRLQATEESQTNRDDNLRVPGIDEKENVEQWTDTIEIYGNMVIPITATEENVRDAPLTEKKST